MSQALDEACSGLLELLPGMEALISKPDDDGSTTRGTNQQSVPPWNAAVAYVVLDVHEGARRLEASLRLALTGDPGHRRGGSLEETEKALKVVAILGAELGLRPAQVAAMIVDRWLTRARQLPAVDEVPVWRKLRHGPDGLPPRCPYCRCFSLLVAVRSRVVRCITPRCEDNNGQSPAATMERVLAGPEAGQPIVVWNDGLVQVAP